MLVYFCLSAKDRRLASMQKCEVAYAAFLKTVRAIRANMVIADNEFCAGERGSGCLCSLVCMELMHCCLNQSYCCFDQPYWTCCFIRYLSRTACDASQVAMDFQLGPSCCCSSYISLLSKINRGAAVWYYGCRCCASPGWSRATACRRRRSLGCGGH